MNDSVSREKGGNASCRVLSGLAVGALGVVFGDIGTSPLYAMRECFHGAYGLPVNSGNVLGVLNCIECHVGK